jgi:hypothetical protein
MTTPHTERASRNAQNQTDQRSPPPVQWTLISAAGQCEKCLTIQPTQSIRGGGGGGGGGWGFLLIFPPKQKPPPPPPFIRGGDQEEGWQPCNGSPKLSVSGSVCVLAEGREGGGGEGGAVCWVGNVTVHSGASFLVRKIQKEAHRDKSPLKMGKIKTTSPVILLVSL